MVLSCLNLAIYFADRAVCLVASLPSGAVVLLCLENAQFVVLLRAGFSPPALFVTLPATPEAPRKEWKCDFDIMEGKVWAGSQGPKIQPLSAERAQQTVVIKYIYTTNLFKGTVKLKCDCIEKRNSGSWKTQSSIVRYKQVWLEWQVNVLFHLQGEVVIG